MQDSPAGVGDAECDHQRDRRVDPLGVRGRDQHEPNRPVCPTAPLNQRGPWIMQRPEPGRAHLSRVPTRQPAAHRLDLLEHKIVAEERPARDQRVDRRPR